MSRYEFVIFFLVNVDGVNDQPGVCALVGLCTAWFRRTLGEGALA